MNAYRTAAVVFLAIAAFYAAGLCAEDLPELQFEKYELANGLDVILHEDHSIPMVTVYVWYDVGSKNEKPGRTGFAHLFEHMMFQGSEHHNVLYDESIDKYGGINNGGTNEDATMYWETMPSNYLEKTLWLEADRMGFLLPALTQERLDIQRNVVMNEKRQNYDDQPYGRARETYHRLLYPEGHPYAWITIGRMEDLAAASLDDVKEFFATYYAPNNASLCIAGDFDPAQAREWVERYFGPIPPGPPIERLKTWVPVLTEEVRARLEDKIRLPRLYMAWNTPPTFAPGDAEFDLLANILSGGKSARLYKELVYDKQIAQDVAAFQTSRNISSSFHITITAKEGHTLAEIEQEVDRILNDIMTNGIEPDEFERARTNWESNFVRSLQNTGGFFGRAGILNGYNIRLGDPGKLHWDKNRYTIATIDGVLSYAREYLRPDARLVLYVEPQGQLAETDAAVDMSAEPLPDVEPSFSPPKIQQAKLANGMDLYLVENHRLPLIQVNLLVKSGWAADPVDRPGTASLTAELLNEGTTSRDAIQISDEMRLLGADFAIDSDCDESTLYLNVLKKNLDPTLDLLADVVINPTFPEEELQRQKKIYLGRIQQESIQPMVVALKAFLRILYGEDHPYGQPYTGTGTTESIAAISRSDIERYYRANYLPNNTAALVVGDITLAEAKSKLERALKKWKSGPAVQTSVRQVSPLDGIKVCLIDKPGAAQSTIVLGNLIGPRNDPRYLPGAVILQVLGGGSIARLFTNLRQDKGYTYGAYSFQTGRRTQGALIAYSQVQGDATKEALVEFMKEMRGITGEIPISEEELVNSKNNFIKGFPRNFQTLGGVAGQLGTMITYDLPLNDWETYIDRVNAVDVDRAIATANEIVHPEGLLIVVVGDLDKIEPKIRELGLGEVVISSLE